MGRVFLISRKPSRRIKMKLTASILIASAQAQGRNREGKDSDNTNTDGASFADSFADYFGGYDYGGSSFDYSGFDDSAFGNYNDAFGTDAPATFAATDAPTAAPTAAPTVAATEDPFAGYDFSGADDAFASYDGADDAANLDDTVADADEGKSSQFIQAPPVFEVDLGTSTTWCYVGEGHATFSPDTNAPVADTAKTAWFDPLNSSWDKCEGANQVCQIKAVRQQNEIASIISQCSNQHSCVDNMRSNMNPQLTESGTNTFFSSWKNQKCRPTFGQNAAKQYNGADIANSARGRARGATNPSECYYCVEPCRNRHVVLNDRGSTDETEQETAIVQSMCIGKSAESFGKENSSAFSNGSFDIFNEDTHMIAVTAFDATTDIDSPYQSAEYTLSKNDVNGVPITQVLEISNIQTEQINQLETVSTAGLEPLVGDIAV